MKYYIERRTIKEDRKLFSEVSPYKVAKVIGVNASYLYRVKDGTNVISEEQYQRIKQTIKDIKKDKKKDK